MVDVNPPPSDEDVILLTRERDNLRNEQLSGKWDEPSAGVSQEAHDKFVQTQLRRAIEINSILRRTNTGPAKPGSKRASRKKPIDIEAIRADLLE